MKSVIASAILIICGWVILTQEPETPLYFELPIKIEGSFEQAEIGTVVGEDFIEPISLELVSRAEKPLFYQSSIRTTVCDDEVCEIMYVRLFWDLVGEYVGYDTISSHPLTKFDHEPFSSTDYEKLHELLQNEGSILKFKQKDELIDKEQVKASDVVDGTTGATAKEIKEEVVEGALYSSFTLWHLAYNGEIENMLKAESEKRLDEELLLFFLSSERQNYRLFAFQNFKDSQYTTYASYWLDALKSDMPLTRKLILKNIPDILWKSSDIQEKIVGFFSFYDVNTRTYLLNKIERFDYFSQKAAEALSRDIRLMNKNQVMQFLSLLNSNKINSTSIYENINSASEDDSFRYSYLLKNYNK